MARVLSRVGGRLSPGTSLLGLRSGPAAIETAAPDATVANVQALLNAHIAQQDGAHGLPSQMVELETSQTLTALLDGSSPPAVLSANANVVARDPNTGTVAVPQETIYAVGGSTLFKSNSVDSSGKPVWTLVWTCTASGYANIRKVLVLQNGYILVACAKNGVSDDSDVTDILRNTDGTATNFTAVANQPLSRGPADYYTRLLNSHSWCQCPANDPVNPGAIFLGEYGTNGSVSHANARNPIGLWKSADNGNSWVRVYTWSTVGGPASEIIRHIHSVQYDPYVPGRIWVTIGDSSAGPAGECRIAYSDDGGVTMHYIVQADGTTIGYQRSRAVGLMFDATRVMWASDTPDQSSATIWSYDRASGAVAQVDAKGIWPNSMQGFTFSTQTQDGTPVFLTCGSLEPLFQPHGGDGYVRVLGSTDGIHWSDSPFKWKADGNAAGAPAGCWEFTDPSPVDGSFWATFQHLDIDPVYNYSGVPQMSFKLVPRVFKAADKPLTAKRTRFEVARQERRFQRAFEDTVGAGLTPAAVQAIPTFGYLEIPLFIAPYDLTLEEVNWLARITYAASGVNYWELRLADWVTPGSGTGFSFTVGVWNHSAAAANRNGPWPQISMSGQHRIRKGHVVTAQIRVGAGVPANLQNLSLDMRYCALNQPLAT